MAVAAAAKRGEGFFPFFLPPKRNVSRASACMNQLNVSGAGDTVPHEKRAEGMAARFLPAPGDGF